MGSQIIKCAGFDDVNWEVRVGVAAKRDAAPTRSFIVKSGKHGIETWLPQLEKQMTKPGNQNGVRG